MSKKQNVVDERGGGGRLLGLLLARETLWC